MAAALNLGDLQQLTMLAVARLGDNAFGGAIQDELQQVAGREVSVSTIHVTLVRLEDQGLVESRRTEPDPARGGKGKRFFNLTPKGWGALETSRNALSRMWEGVNPA
jgi:DNA-binding PadR family transcriptional regulator